MKGDFMENCNSYISEIINKILLLQRQDFDCDTVGCDRPFLGPSPTSLSYNTRPVQLYNRYTANEWSFSYTTETGTETTSIFRIEDVEQCSVTVRLLAFNQETSTYTNTNQFVTIDISTIGAIRCLSDTFISL